MRTANLYHSKHQVDLVPLHPASQWTPDWNETVRLKNAHGEDIVRSVYLDHLVSSLHHKEKSFGENSNNASQTLY